MTAFVEHVTIMICDEPGCGQQFKRKLQQHRSSDFAYTRDLAADAGWSYNDLKGDFCPEHQP